LTGMRGIIHSARLNGWKCKNEDIVTAPRNECNPGLSK
jgi:hypothetical protein